MFTVTISKKFSILPIGAVALFVVLFVCGGCGGGAKNGGENQDGALDGGTEADGAMQGDGGTGDDGSMLPDATPQPPNCSDGIRNGNETGHDCGGDCANQDCCTNGYADVELGETGVDCGGDCGPCEATTYFISNAGDDDNNSGTNPAEPWATIERVQTETLEPGDAVLFERGGTWRETLSIHESGTPQAYIMYGAYGMGKKPRILGSVRGLNWTEVEDNIWESGNESILVPESPGHGDHAASIFFGEQNGAVTWGRMQALHLDGGGAPTAVYRCDEEGARFSLLGEEYDWCWQDNKVYVYSPEDPEVRYAYIEVPQRDATITMSVHPPCEYISIDGLELMYGIKYGYDNGWPMNVSVRGLTIQNCHIAYFGVKGAASAMGLQIWHSDMLVRNNVIHDSGRRNISYNVYGDVRNETLVFENVVFEHNELHSGFHTTGFDISCGYGDTFQNFIFRNNFVWDDPNDDPSDGPNDFTSMGFFLNSGPATFTGFKVYNNILKYTKQKSLVLAGVSNTDVFNNTFYSMNERAGGEYRGMVNVSGDVQNLRMENNIFYGDVDPAQFVLQCVVFSDGSESGTTMNHNLFYQEFTSQRTVTINSSGSSYSMNEWSEYLSDTGWGTDSPAPADPLFVDPAGNDFRLQPGSPAIDAGGEENERTTDYAGNPVVGTPDIGALEYQGD